MEKQSIYLDDFRSPIEHPEDRHWVVVRSYDQFVKTVSEIGLANIDMISFDHDLDESAMIHYFEYVRKNYSIDYSQILEKTGLDAAKWLVEHSKETSVNIPKCYIHSANPIGSGNILGYINMYLKERRLPETCTRTRWKYTR